MRTRGYNASFAGTNLSDIVYNVKNVIFVFCEGHKNYHNLEEITFLPIFPSFSPFQATFPLFSPLCLFLFFIPGGHCLENSPSQKILSLVGQLFHVHQRITDILVQKIINKQIIVSKIKQGKKLLRKKQYFSPSFVFFFFFVNSKHQYPLMLVL